MSSTPNGTRRLLAISWLGGLLVAGCQLQQHAPAPEPLNATPINTDSAMALRQWGPTSAYYQNDSVYTWPDYAPLQPKPLQYELNLFTEPVLFLGNTFYLPVDAFMEPGWREQIFKSMSCPPSYTLMPPLPGGPEPVPQ
jgi:hypothetical protein